MSPKPTVIKRPRRPDRLFATFRAQFGASVVVGLLVALLGHKKVFHISTVTIPLASAVATFIVLNAARTIFLVPPAEEAVHQPDPAQLTGSITSAVRSSYAISSNWISLWSRPNFRYYLHLDAVASLIAYSFRFGASLLRVSRDESDIEEFFNDGTTLIDEIASGEGPVHKHRLRILIYPEWVYAEHRGEIEQLIRSHSAARISCIPLVADRLYDVLTGDERAEVWELSKLFGQTTLDKAPPRAMVIRWFVQARLYLNLWLRPSWVIVFPDLLLVDADIANDTSNVWWYPSSGDVKKARYDHESDIYAKAASAFRIICKHAPDSLWDNYAVEILGGVAVGSSSKWLDSEAFFDREHYDTWRKWISEHWRGDTNAGLLNAWIVSERTLLNSFVDEAMKAQAVGDSGEQGEAPRLLDIGCGTGEDIVETLQRYPSLHASGVDIVESNISRATARIHQAQMGDRVALIVGDAATLIDFGDDEVDMAICMTNTLGNLIPEKQEGLLRRLHDVLRPTGRALISVYSPASVPARMATYKAINLHMHQRPGCLLATEGLRSQHFEAGTLRTLIESSGLVVCGEIRQATTIGLAAIVRPGGGEPQ
jgi:ubiquinone/menaquinone biosynthesis C-methylase UbiE